MHCAAKCSGNRLAASKTPRGAACTLQKFSPNPFIRCLLGACQNPFNPLFSLSHFHTCTKISPWFFAALKVNWFHLRDVACTLQKFSPNPFIRTPPPLVRTLLIHLFDQLSYLDKISPWFLVNWFHFQGIAIEVASKNSHSTPFFIGLSRFLKSK